MKTLLKTLLIAMLFMALGGATAANAASTGTQLSFCEQLDAQGQVEQARLTSLTTTINEFVAYLMYDKPTSVTVGEFAWSLQLYGVTADNLGLIAYARGAYCYSPVLPINLLE